MKNKILILFILLLHLFDALAQIELNAGPVSGFEIDKWYEISIDSQITQSLADFHPPKDSGYQFAVPVPVEITPSSWGTIHEQSQEMVWTVGIRSKNAKSLNLILEPFIIPEGAYVYIYNSGLSEIRGAFTGINNNSSELLPTMPVKGEEIILEYHFPKNVNPEGTLGISQVAHDYLGIFGDNSKDGRFNMSQPCNLDINCTEGAGFETEKRSVCRIIVRGVELCTGVLINNTNQQNRPLLITAQHCIVDQNDASKSVFVFGYESPWCDGPDGRVTHSLSGSLLQSTNAEIDFSLVELSKFPPVTYKPYLAGWDVSGTIPLNTATIHHPQGDVKKISVDLNSPVTASFQDYLSNGFWKILQWETGTTEGGSSGAPLFDQNKRVIGLLTGGEAICGRSVNDYFAKLSSSYNHSPILWQQLKGWIDPAQSGLKQLNGRDPYAANLLASDTLSNILSTELPAAIEYSTPGSGYAAGYNSDSLVQYAEYFQNPLHLQISEVIIHLAKVNTILNSDSVRIYLYADGTVPGQVLASQKYLMNEAKDSFMLHADFVSPVTVGGNFYVGWRIWYREPARSEARQYAVFHSPARINPALNTAWFNKGSGWKRFTEHPSLPMAVSLDVKAIGVTDPVVDRIDIITAPGKSCYVYPNPAGSEITVSSRELSGRVSFILNDISGKIIMSGSLDGIFPGDARLDVSSLNHGLYILSIMSEEKTESHRILVFN